MLLTNLFPSYGVKNIHTYHLVSILSNGWFQIGNWLLFVLIFVSAYEFSIYEAIAFFCGLLLEIPSGAVADLLGKKKTVLIGLFMQTIGSCIFMLAHLSDQYLFWGNLIIISGFAFISGSMEALVYDSLVQTKKQHHYPDIAKRNTAAILITLVLAASIGGYIWKWGVYWPWGIATFSFFLAFLTAFRFQEPKIDTQTFTIKTFIKQTKTGFHNLISPKLWKYTPLLIAILGVDKMWTAGILRPLMGTDFGFNGSTINYVISAGMILSAIVAWQMPWLRRHWGDLTGCWHLVTGLALAYTLSYLHVTPILGALIFFILQVVGQLSYPWISVVINDHITSSQRATTISTLQFFVQMPYVIIVIFYGKIYELGYSRYFYLSIAIILYLILTWSIYTQKRLMKKLAA